MSSSIFVYRHVSARCIEKVDDVLSGVATVSHEHDWTNESLLHQAAQFRSTDAQKFKYFSLGEKALQGDAGADVPAVL